MGRRRAIAALLAPLLLPAAGARPAAAHCRCRPARRPRCANVSTRYRVTVNINFEVGPDGVEVLTQSGPYHVPVADLDGKTVLMVFMPRGEVFQGFIEAAVPGGLAVGTMQGATARIATGAVFAPGEYELLLFIDAVPGGGAGPQHGDLAAFDNGGCDPTGVSVRVAVGCQDATVSLTNRHFIIF